MRRNVIFFVFILVTVLCTGLHSYAGDGRKGKDNCAEEKIVSSSFSFDEKTSRLTMSFEEDELKTTEPQKLRFFRKRKFFKVNEAFELPKELCEALGTTGPILIKCGNYPIEYKEGTFTIVLCSGA